MKKIIFIILLASSFSFAQKKFLNDPLVTEIFTADPSAHIFNGKIYVYPSHDILLDNPPVDDCGGKYAMRDYRVLSMNYIGGPVKIHDVGLDLDDVPWAKRQFWAPDAAEKDGKFYLYFPTKDNDDIFKIGAAVSDNPEGPFKPEDNPIPGSYSMDPSVFKDDDGSYYMYFGGIWGGQLQRWRKGVFNASQPESPTAFLPKDNEPALLPYVAKMTNDLLQFDESPKEVKILDENGNLLLAGDNDRRFFEAAWLHKYKGKYYFSYSTGDTHFICYAIGDNPYGPFTYSGRILNPVVGWTSHHSICEYKGKWYLFYHDSSLSKGVTHLRSVKIAEIKYNDDGTIQTLNPYN